MLSARNEQQVHLKLITDAVADLGSANVDVITLNHDLLLEESLDNAKQPWVDGFDNERFQNEMMVDFSSDQFLATERIRIAKIHGSVNWYYADRNGTGWKCWKIANLTQARIEPQVSLDFETGQILTGSTTKALAYTKGTFGMLHLEACRLLKESPTIVCSGYGWKDGPFNEMIRDWSKHHPKPRMWLLHDEGFISEFDEVKKPYFWPDNWKDNAPSSWLKWHRQFLSDTNWIHLAAIIRQERRMNP
jgi:hypothetical protein